MRITVTPDVFYSNQFFMGELKKAGKSFILVAKPTGINWWPAPVRSPIKITG